MKDHRGIAVLKAFVTQVCCSKCVRQGSVVPPILWKTLAKFLLGSLDTEWRIEDWGLHVLVETASMTDGVMEESLLGCSPVLKKSWRCLLLELIARATRLGVEPEPDSLWWTPSYKRGTSDARVLAR